jgi:hypothetical protein
MRHVYWSMFAIALVGGTTVAQGATAEPIRLILPSGIDAERCYVSYMMAGPFGGYGRHDRAVNQAFAYTIDVVHNGAVARTLKALVACPGFHIQTFTFDELPPPHARNLTVSLQARPKALFLGRISNWTQQSDDLQLEVDYVPRWICRFFRLADCMLGAWTLASVPVSVDGRFAADLPDLTQDPAVQSYQPAHPQDLRFLIRNRTTGSTVYDLKPVGGAPTPGRLAIQPGYPEEHVFDIE